MTESPSPMAGIIREKQKDRQNRALIRKHLAHTLRQLRAEQGVSQQAAAEFLQVSRCVYVFYETGKVLPDVTVLLRLTSLFQVPLETFLPENLAL